MANPVHPALVAQAARVQDYLNGASGVQWVARYDGWLQGLADAAVLFEIVDTVDAFRLYIRGAVHDAGPRPSVTDEGAVAEWEIAAWEAFVRHSSASTLRS